MKREYVESDGLVSPMEDSSEYDFVLATEVVSAETTTPPGMRTGISQASFHGHNIYAFSSENREVLTWDQGTIYDNLEELNENSDNDRRIRFNLGEVEDLEEIVTSVLDRSDATITGYEEFESPINPYNMEKAIEKYTSFQSLGT